MASIVEYADELRQLEGMWRYGGSRVLPMDGTQRNELFFSGIASPRSPDGVPHSTSMAGHYQVFWEAPRPTLNRIGI